MDIMDTLVNEVKYVNFYGVDNNCFKLGKVVLEAVEDPHDGYRSFLEAVVVRDGKDLIFSGVPITEVKVVKGDNLREDIFKLVDKAGRVWLRFGTDCYDAYYPMFVFEYTPHKYALLNGKDLINAFNEV